VKGTIDDECHRIDVVAGFVGVRVDIIIIIIIIMQLQ
jgi:hypothetical protein